MKRVEWSVTACEAAIVRPGVRKLEQAEEIADAERAPLVIMGAVRKARRSLKRSACRVAGSAAIIGLAGAAGFGLADIGADVDTAVQAAVAIQAPSTHGRRRAPVMLAEARHMKIGHHNFLVAVA